MTFSIKGLKTAVFAAAFAVAVSPVSAKNFKVAVGDGAGGTQEALGKAFIEALEKNTNKKHTATLFLNGQLGSEQDTVNNAAMGALDFSILAINNITPFSPSVGTLTLPYVILSLEDAQKSLLDLLGNSWSKIQSVMQMFASLAGLIPASVCCPIPRSQ